mmetsp:Transcript_13414/g.31521  ORF Transcript_13414/g.31521 Transcript_13414/m.31521 type:complete len:784 (-) Transcript_13414:90-2441(-)
MGQGGSTDNASVKEDLADLSLEYKYSDLRNATRGFSSDNRLGSGAAGAVYRGCLTGGTEVAVKVIADAQGLDGFLEEVRMLSRFRHPNLVTLMGWGQHENEKYLVYELLSGGDVSKKLEKSKRGEVPFPWEQRLKVAVGAAAGLSYMANSKPKAFHRDIKPANILLDTYGVAKVADFGLSGIVKDKGNHLTVAQVAGTPGYACPVYIKEKRVSEQSEVYSFGTVLLELLVNEPPALAGPNGQIVFPLLQRLQPSAPGADQRVMGNLDATAGWPPPLAVPMGKLALDCIGPPERRPTFAKIAEVLRGHHSKFSGQTDGLQVTAAPPRMPGGWQAHRPPAPPPFAQQEYGYGGPAQGNGYHNGHSNGYHKVQAAAVARDEAFGKKPSHRDDSNGRRKYDGYDGPSKQVNGYRNENAYRNGPPDPAKEQASVHYGGATGSTSRPSKPRGEPADEGRQLAEIILECLHGDGVDVASLPPAQRALVFVIKPGQKRLCEPLGRNYQADFLDRLVLREQQGFISRTHCELLWDAPDTAPRLRKLTMNPILIDEKLVRDGEAIPLLSGTRIGLMQTRDSGSACFLSMQVLLRDVATVRASGPHPATATPPPPPQRSLQHSKTKALGPTFDRAPSVAGLSLLECVYAAGIDVGEFTIEERSITLQIDNPVEVGRQHQVNFFDNLLRKDRSWLTFISRSHCRLTLERPAGTNSMPLRVEELAKLSAPMLRIENLSNNVIFVGDNALARGQCGTLNDSGLLEFAAAPDGPNNVVKFLKFRLRKQPSTGRRNSQS